MQVHAKAQAALVRITEHRVGLCRVYTEAAETYLPLIISSTDLMPLVAAVLDCTAHPSRTIAMEPLYFWNRLCENLVKQPKPKQEVKPPVPVPCLATLVLPVNSCRCHLPSPLPQRLTLRRHSSHT